MLKLSTSESMFSEFSNNYQSYSKSERPYVYVDPEGNVKLLTDVVDDNGKENGIFAVSVAEDGWMEFLSLYE